MRSHRWAVLALALVCVGCAAAALSDDIQLSALAQANRHHEIIGILQPKLDRGETVSSFQLFLLCVAYYEIRDYDTLLDRIKLLEQRIAAGDRSYVGGDLTVYPTIFRAGVHVDLAEYDGAEKGARRAYAMLHQDGRDRQFFYRQQMILRLLALGVSQALQDRKDEARKTAEELAKIDLSNSNLGPEKFNGLARIYMAIGDFDKALAAIRHPNAKVSAALAAHYDTTFQDVPKFFILAKSLFETGETAEARQLYDKLLKHPQIAQCGGIYWLVLLDRARIARAESNPMEAIALLKKAVDVIERQRSSIDTESGRIGYVGDKQAVYQELISLLVAGRDDAEAFEYVERAKARALVDLLASQDDIAVRAGNADKIRSSIMKLTQAEADLNAFHPAETSARTRGVVIGIRKDLLSEAPEAASLVTVTGTPTKDVQARLAPDEALLEYYYSDSELYVFVLTREGVRAVRLDRADLEEHIKAFRTAVATPGSLGYPAAARKLHEQILTPIFPALRGKKLIIVPHSLLHYVPFDALYSGTAFLLEETSLRIAPSAAALRFLREPKGGDRGMLVLGNPDMGDRRLDLKFAQDEALSVAKKVQSSKVLLRADATETAVKRHGDRFRILHFATHGVFDMAEPLHSALLLAKDEENDGMLSVGELYTLRLDADLVTLSACETALGKVANGDDVVGFTRGLLYAGSSSIVSSLWKVDDRATKLLMERFYENWMKGTPKASALREAKLWLMGHKQDAADAEASVPQNSETGKGNTPYAHPYYWAAFQLVGRSE